MGITGPRIAVLLLVSLAPTLESGAPLPLPLLCHSFAAPDIVASEDQGGQAAI